MAANTKCNLPEKVIQDISLFAENHDIEKVILFGSRARGDHAERSDIDIAVLGGNFDGFYWDIQENIRSLLMFDIVDLNQKISDELKEAIEEDGIVLYEKV